MNFFILSSSEVKFGKSFPYKKSSPALAIRSFVLLFDKLLHPIARNKNSIVKKNFFKDYYFGGL